AILWTALTTWSESSIQVEQLWKWLIVLSLPVDALAGSIWGWLKQNDHDPGAIKYRTFTDYAPHRLAFAWWAVRAVMLALLAFAAGTDVPGWAVGVAATFYACGALSWLFVVVVGFWDLPYKVLHSTEINPAYWFGWLLFLCLLVAAELAYVGTIPFIKPGQSVDAPALATLIVAAQLLLFRVLYDLKPIQAIPALVQIRRGLLLGRIDLMAAIHSTEVALVGFTAGSVVEEYLRKLLLDYRRYEDLSTRTYRALADLAASTNVLGGGRIDQVSRSRSLHAGEEQHKNIVKLMSRVDRFERQLAKRSDQFVALVTEVRSEVPELLRDWKDGLLLQLSSTADREDKAFRSASQRLHEDYGLAMQRWQSVTNAVPASGSLSLSQGNTES
ncbi:MAG TPA: hypothetical protein VLK84_28860, partial [Longimicrobium sp.]|nr:hypothetical protein [Longimicrobium sp.]